MSRLSSQLSGPARGRQFVNDALIGLGLILPLSVLAKTLWAFPVALAVAVWLAVVVIGVALWRLRRFDRPWLIARLNARQPDLEDSADLLFAQEPPSPLQALQRDRLHSRLTPETARNLRDPWRLWPVVVVWGVGIALTTAILFWPTGGQTPVTPLAPKHTVTGPAKIVAQALRVTPPAYTGQAAHDEPSLNARAPHGSQLVWTLRVEPDARQVEIVFHDGQRLPLRRDGQVWTASWRLATAALYRIAVDGVEESGPPHRLDVVTDIPPQIRVVTPDRSLSLVTPGQRRWPLLFEVTDDYGVAAQGQLRLVLAQGEGENVTFRERTLTVSGTGDRVRKRFAVDLDLGQFGYAIGDDLIVQLSVSDNRAPGPQTAKSPSLILRWPSNLGDESGALEGMVRKALPAYFRSQRQIIIDAEALLKEKARLSSDTYLNRSDTIGVDQRTLRLRYGQFLGEEAAGEPAAPEGSTAGHGDDHGHDEGHAESSAGFGADENVLEMYGHTHDESEAATLLDPETRATLKKALDEMWQSELHLRQGHPERALPHAYKALGFIKQVQQATRIFLARVGPDLPPVDENRRLTGKRDGLADRALSLAPVALDEAPVALWHALWQPPGQDLPLAGFEAWLMANRDRVADPLSLMAAMDAVRRDPACTACRATLRDQMWAVLPRPAVRILRRQGLDAHGARYLDTLRQEGR